MPTLELYYSPTCPYCVKVLRFIQAQGIQGVELKDIAIAANYHTLVTVGGMDQYPCLFIDGKPLYESDDIIAWLGANAR